jgi:V8-like Glu-specific endopeptidase
VAAVGALFPPRGYPLLHTCTASVIDSASGDVVLTAAHCVTGSGVGYRFVPGYRDGKTPYGVWSVTAAYGDPQWIHGRNPRRDWAFLTVAERRLDGHLSSLQSVTGGHPLGRAAVAGSRVTVIGYAVGGADRALRCDALVYLHRGWPAFDCGGFVGGTSGSPWLRHGRRGISVTGVIGGLHQGGCTPSTSYSAVFGNQARRSLARAARHGRADVFPPRGSDGCS